MKTNRALSAILMCLILLVSFYGSTHTHSQTKIRKATGPTANNAGFFAVRRFGAKGDGKTVDSPAINRAIDAAAAAGGGTVFFSAGTYRCFSILCQQRTATIGAASAANGVPILSNLECLSFRDKPRTTLCMVQHGEISCWLVRLAPL